MTVMETDPPTEILDATSHDHWRRGDAGSTLRAFIAPDGHTNFGTNVGRSLSQGALSAMIERAHTRQGEINHISDQFEVTITRYTDIGIHLLKDQTEAE